MLLKNGGIEMQKLEKTIFGFKNTFTGTLTANEMKQWLNESKKQLESSKGKFQVLIDMRGLDPLVPEAQAVLEEGQKIFKLMGMERSCVILDRLSITLQFKRITKKTDIIAFERFIDASKQPDWMEKAMLWLTKGEEPAK